MYASYASKMSSSFWLLFGSQTGQSEAIANQLAEKARHAKLKPKILALDDFFVKEINRDLKEVHGHALIIISSTGDGDSPDNSLKFVREICKKSLDSSTLQKLKFSLLGLGDSNYSTFHGCPKKVERRLLDLGAVKFYETGLADDAVGLEATVEPWIESVIPVLKKSMESGEVSISNPMEELSLNEVSSAAIEAKKSGNEIFTCTLPKSSERPWKGEEDEEEEDIDLSLTNCSCKWAEPSLKKGAEELSKDEQLRVPLLQESTLSVSFNHERPNPSEIPWQNNAEFPGTLGGLKLVVLKSLKEITGPNALVRKFEFSVDFKGQEINYEPGDAFYVVYANPPDEVEYVLRRVKLAVLGDNKCSVSGEKVPPYIPNGGTLRNVLTYCLDIRRTLGRPFLRIMAEYAENESDKRRLLELTSSQGLKEFTEFVRKQGLSLCDLLHAFPSVILPLERLFEHLPRLQPRPYSVACYQPISGTVIRFAFSEVVIPKGDGRFYHRNGLCTSWLLQRNVGDTLNLIFQEPKWFRLPNKAEEVPLIMVGPGTGITPFLGFLQLLRKRKSDRKPKRFCFFGFRTENVDDIYREELESFLNDGTLTKLFLCESRPLKEEKRHKYVQDAIKSVGEEVVALLGENVETELESRIYVCGDAKGMSKDLYQTLIELVEKHSGKSKKDAIEFLSGKKQRRTYSEDVWS